MVFFGGLLGLLALGVWIFCIIDVLTTPREQVRNLPKFAWLFVVVLLVDIGSIAWLFAGRPWNVKATTPGGAGRSGYAGLGTSASTPRRAPRRPLSPDDDDEFLAGLSRRAEDERRHREGGTDGPAPSA